MLSMALYLRNFFIVMRLLANSQKIHNENASNIPNLTYLAYDPGSHLIMNLSFGMLNYVKGAYSRLNGK